MEELQWSKPGEALATIMFPRDDLNHTVVLTLIPGTDGNESRRGIIGDKPTDDDRVNIENFDHAFARIRKKEKRIIRVFMLHEKKKFKLFLAFSFKGALENPGKVFEVETDASGVTALEILAVL